MDSNSSNWTFALMIGQSWETEIEMLYSTATSQPLGLPLWLSGKKKNTPIMQETWVWSLGREDSPGEGSGTPLQYSCLENPMDRGAWQATVHGVANSQTRLNQLGMHATVRLKFLILSLLPFGMLKTCVLKTVLSIISHELSNLSLWQSSHVRLEVWPRAQQKNSRWQKSVESLNGERINLL